MPIPSPTLAVDDRTDVDTWQALIGAARSGCDQALGEISSKTRDYLLLVANHRFNSGLRAKFGASDVVQQSLLEACECFDGFSGNSEAEFRSWIKQIVINNLIDESRRYTQTKSRNTDREIRVESFGSTPDHSQLTASAITCNRETDSELEAAIDKLSLKQQQVILLKHRFALDYPAIAGQMKISESAVRMLWSRAIAQLKNILGNASD